MKVFTLSIVAAAASVALAQTPAPPAPKPRPASSAKPAAAGAKTPAKPMTEAKVPADASADQVVMTVGPDKITAAEFNGFIDSLPEQYKAQAQGPMKRQVAEQIASMRLLANEARQRGLDKDKAMQNRIRLQTENLLAGAALQELMKTAPVDAAAIQKYYDEHKNEYEQVQARHILIRFKGSPVPVKEGQKDLTEEEALAKVQAIRKRLAGGEDFEKVAKAESDDTGSGAAGGDLGMFKRGSMVPAFEEVAFNQPLGELSEPVKTQFGYHLIKTEKHENKKLDEVKGEIESRLKPEMAQKTVEDLKKKSNVTYNDAFFGPAAMTAPPVPAPAK